MSDIFATPAAAAGQNVPDYAKEETARLEMEHAALSQSLTAALKEARGLPATCDDEEQLSQYAEVIKRLRDLNGRIEKVRVGEKEPHLRRGTAVDSYFGTMLAKLFRKNKNDKAGAADVLQARVNDYQQRKEAEERRRREEADRAARAEARRLADEAAEKARIAQEEAERAARARKPENKEAAQDAADAAAAEARRLDDEAELARQKAQETAADAVAKPADLVRTRTDSGHTVTAKQVPYIEIVDEMKLDAVALWPFVKSDAKLAALRDLAKARQYKLKMDGAIVEMRSQAVIR
ncbi:MAG TPA: hypothetical protein VIU44_05305 [Gaiellaceae bacterium]